MFLVSKSLWIFSIPDLRQLKLALTKKQASIPAVSKKMAFRSKTVTLYATSTATSDKSELFVPLSAIHYISVPSLGICRNEAMHSVLKKSHLCFNCLQGGCQTSSAPQTGSDKIV